MSKNNNKPEDLLMSARVFRFFHCYFGQISLSYRKSKSFYRL